MLAPRHYVALTTYTTIEMENAPKAPVTATDIIFIL